MYKISIARRLSADTTVRVRPWTLAELDSAVDLFYRNSIDLLVGGGSDIDFHHVIDLRINTTDALLAGDV